MLTLRRCVVGVVTVLLVSGVALAQTSETADIAALRVRANAGDAGAQHNLGYAYSNGQGVPQDYAQSASWYRKAAEQGHAGALSCLGVLYRTGHGVQEDFAQAVSWYRQAAEQGHAEAQCIRGVKYNRCLGLEVRYYRWNEWM